MSRPRGRRASLVAATMLTAVLALAGCSAGAVTQTDTALSGAPGAFGQAGEVIARDMSLDAGPTQVVPAGAGSTVTVLGTLVNDGGLPDRLVSVSSPYALQATVEGPSTIPGDNALRLVGAQGGAVGPAQPDTRQAATARITLRGVTQNLRPGPTYAVTFTFERSGAITLPLIVTGSGSSAG